jgi:ABC-type multidrug transport system fused ATPase/permease subunit
MTGLPSLFGTGLGLAAGAGLNSYAVLLVYGGLARLFPHDFPGPAGEILSTNTALVTVGVLYLLEFFVDKIPGADHVWDVLHSIVRPLAGAFLAMSVVQPQGDSFMTAVAAGSGGVVALTSHFVKSATRLTSTALTAGVANIALSIAEDVLAFLQALVSIFLPLVALAVVIALGAIFLFTVPRLARSIDLIGRRRRPPRPAV